MGYQLSHYISYTVLFLWGSSWRSVFFFCLDSYKFFVTVLTIFSCNAASHAALWYPTSSLYCNVSTWWHICPSIYSSSILSWPLLCFFSLQCITLISVILDIFWIYQGSYPFSPFAVPSSNGVADASVSTKLYNFENPFWDWFWISTGSLFFNFIIG